MRVVGIDVGARRFHAVALDGEALTVAGCEVFDAGRLDELAGWASGADQVGIDSPDRWSSAPHRDDHQLAPKFRTARCGEIALGCDHGIWVPWTTPVEPVPGWIQVGIELFAALRAEGHEPVEVYPYAAFRLLAGGRRPPPKQTAAGARARVDLLRQAGLSEPSPARWSHDALDATAAAVVAFHRALGWARPATCGHDGSAIWLPAAAANPGP